MAKYQPPHLRNREPQAAASTSVPSHTGRDPIRPSTTTPLNGSGATITTPSAGPSTPRASVPSTHLPRSTKDWSTPSRRLPAGTYNLASPASDIRPSSRNATPRPTGGDEMDMIQSVSRSGGDGAEGDALKDWKLQERFRGYIDERLAKHYESFPGQRDRPPDPANAEAVESLSSIVLLFRKLREGVVASGRIDSFALEVFESSARISILARNTAQLISSLSGLIPGLYTAVSEDRARQAAVDGDQDQALANSMDKLAVGVNAATQLEPTDDRVEFACLYLLYHLCHSGDIAAYHALLFDLTQPRRRHLRQPFVLSDLTNLPRSQAASIRHDSTEKPARPFVPASSLELVRHVRRCLAPESFDPSTFFALSNSMVSGRRGCTPYELAILCWAAAGVRLRAWQMLQRAYMTVEIGWTSRVLGMPDAEVRTWVAEHGASVERDRIKLR